MPRPQRRKARDESRGVIGRTIGESKPFRALEGGAPEGAPNVVYVVLSDVGFGHLDCFGGLGGIVDTPYTTRLAASGLRYTDFHTPGFPSASRSCLLAGRNHHSNGLGAFLAGATAFPGYTGRIPSSNGLLTEMLVDLGYNTFAVGEWHLAPVEEQSAAGPYLRWPLGKGVERFYGFLDGETSQWYPSTVYDNHPVDPPRTPEEG